MIDRFPIPPKVRRSAAALVTILLSLAIAACGDSGNASNSLHGTTGPVPPLFSAGRWLTDATGRVVMLHGFNEVAKSPPFYPAAFGFGDDDAAFLAGHGFNAIRLGIDFRGLMPEPGEIDTTYIERLAETVDVLTKHDIFVLLDFHQDGFSPMFNGNGLPDWMAISDGLPNPPDAVFPLYYVQNPAMQRAFEHFWSDSPGPKGVGLQQDFLRGVAAVVERFAENELVFGTELLNEPWSGAIWQPCTDPGVGCPMLERDLLVPFYERGTETVRRIAPRHLVFVEPFVLFNFGQAPTTLPGAAPGTSLSFHSYALDVAGEEQVLDYAVAAAERDQAAVVVTEFGATTDAKTLDRLVTQMERRLLPWLDWAYNESIIADSSRPAGLDNLRSPEAFAALTRPYPVALAGTPTRIAFDAATKVFELDYAAIGPSGERFPADLASVVSLPPLHYSGGYEVSVTGAAVTSGANASLLTLRSDSAASTVTLRVTPLGS